MKSDIARHDAIILDVLLLEGTVLDRGLKEKGVGEFKSETEIEDETGKYLSLIFILLIFLAV